MSKKSSTQSQSQTNGLKLKLKVGKSQNKDDEAKKERNRSNLVSDEVSDDEYYQKLEGSQWIAPHRNFSTLTLKPDHRNRPIWVCPNGHVFLETYSQHYRQAYDFLIAIADPLTRPRHIHEYKITPYSLYAAASLGLRTEDIVATLNRLSKVELEPGIVDFIKERTLRCGKVRLLLRKTRYFIESPDVALLERLLSAPAIADARIDHIDKAVLLAEQKKQIDPLLARGYGYGVYAERLAKIDEAKEEVLEIRDQTTGFLVSVTGEDEPALLIPGTGAESKKADARAAMGISAEDIDALDEMQDPEGDKKKTLMFEVDPKKVEDVRRVCNELEYPLLEEYDFRKDSGSADLLISLKPSTRIRDYQEKSLSKMFGNGRARSGIIVLPCGAGKTLVGITAMSTVKKSCLIFCTTGVSVDQWRRQILMWTTLDPKYVCCFTSSKKDVFPSEAFVLITTYSMVAFTGKRAVAAEAAMKVIESQEWGLVLLDEVHVAPAKMFRRCISKTHSRSKLGLTATLVREDTLVEDLYFLVGPKLYEANWYTLQQAGYIATVQCIEVWCMMTAEFYQAYLETSAAKQRLLYVMNPNKFRACEYLIRLHEARGDKVLVFSDNVFALREYALTLNKPFIFGGTSDAERLKWLQHFQYDSHVNTLFISKVGDASIDLPDVNVIIQISSHFSSRRQEAQRLGRILRPKHQVGRFNAFFYTLVSQDTMEMKYATKRQRFLVDQGYAFKVVTELAELKEITDLKYSEKDEQRKLLVKVMAAEDKEGATESVEEDPFDIERKERFESRYGATGMSTNETKSKGGVRRKGGDLSALTGANGDMVYGEFKRGKEKKARGGRKASQTKSAVPKGDRHSLFRSRQEKNKKKRKEAAKEAAAAASETGES